MKHKAECRWERTTDAECVYRATHHYCPHPEHACDCAKPENATMEAMAEAIHDAYLATCERLGWEVRPANRVPYSQLSDDSKELDRASVRAVLSFGQPESAAPVAERTEWRTDIKAERTAECRNPKCNYMAVEWVSQAGAEYVNGCCTKCGAVWDRPLTADESLAADRILALRSEPTDLLLDKLDRMSDEEIVEFADMSAAFENREYNALTVRERETSGIRFRAKHERRHFRALLSRLRKEDV